MAAAAVAAAAGTAAGAAAGAAGAGAGPFSDGGSKGGLGFLRQPKRHIDQHHRLRFCDILPKPGGGQGEGEGGAAAPPPVPGPLMGVITLEKDSTYSCKLCARRYLLTEAALNQHCESQKHRTAVRLSQMQKKMPEAAAAGTDKPAAPTTTSAVPSPDRLRIESDSYDPKKGEHSKVVVLGESQTLTFRVTNVSANTVFRFQSWQAATLSEEFTLQDPTSSADENIVLKPSMQLKLNLKMSPKEESVHAFKLLFRFDDVTRSTVSAVSTNVKASFVTQQTRDLSSTGGYYDSRQRRPPRKAFYRRGAAVPGKPLPVAEGMDNLEKKRPLPWFDMPEHVHNFINDGMVVKRDFTASQTEELNAYKQALTEDQVTFHNYRMRFSCLLYLEEHQTEVDMESYFMERVRLHRHGNSHLLSLVIPGLAENRPSVLRGDQMFVRQYLGPENYGPKEYQGYVHEVQQTRVFLGFSQQLVNKHHEGAEYCVRFVQTRLPLRIEHRALTIVESDESGLENVLFPTEDTARTQRWLLDATTELKFYARQPEPNPEQAQAIKFIVMGSSRPAPYIVFGPPGTGKTFTIVEAIKQVVKLLPKARVLACAPSNSAADLIAERLVDHLQKRQVYRLNAFSRNSAVIPDKVKDISNLSRTGEICFPSKDTLIQQGVKVFVTTLITAGRLVSAQFDEDFFTHVVVDEASHATEPEAVSALAGLLYVKGDKDNSGAKQVVLAGDPRQLGPILRSPFAKKFKLDVSLMERLMELPIYGRREGSSQQGPAQPQPFYDPLLITKLVRNYRSHPAILEVPNELFYNGDLVPSGLPELTHQMCGWEELPCKDRPVVFHAVIGEDMQETNSPSFFNPYEIRQVMAYVDLLVSQKSPTGVRLTESHVGIISPYSKQVQKIRSELRKKGLEGVKVGTVEEFQGQERLIIIVSTVRSNPRFLNTDSKFSIGFLQNNKRFNVAVTRPKALLIVIGNPNVLRHNRSWSRFVEVCRQSGCMVHPHLDRTDEDETFQKLRDLLDELDKEDTSEITADDWAKISALNNEQTFKRDL